LRLVVTGGRDLTNEALVWATLDEIHAKTPITTIAEGGHKKGCDHFVRRWALSRRIGVRRTFEVTKVEWTKLGKAAGPIRNGRMLREVDPYLVLAFPTGGPGTNNCIKQARALGIEVRIIETGQERSA